MEGPVIAAAILVVLLLIYNHYSPAFNAYQLQVLSNDSAALGLAAIGETLVVLTGGFDLSPLGRSWLSSMCCSPPR
jgi:ribose transport system permease protein